MLSAGMIMDHPIIVYESRTVFKNTSLLIAGDLMRTNRDFDFTTLQISMYIYYDFNNKRYRASLDAAAFRRVHLPSD